VFERTRELGLIRAVGMTRRQLRRMVRFEAAVVATFGAVLGVGIGILFGSGIVTALPDSFASSVSIPVQSIAILILIAATAGMIAAWLPARRAGRLNVLDAIAH
ncbi:MAG: ABC transporter permease, partial [Actinobacteria bacterium]|nr:ABC transporter permease [Actinomycetota bacterium]